jgi:teichuronic acid biosynthesis glycosyltransferase TuaG
MGSAPLVSIIIPTFNMERYITETIESVRKQSFKDWEVIVVDDCSTDSTGLIVNRLVELDPRIRYFRLSSNSNLPAVPRNYGIKQSRGKYIAFLDHDDLWSPSKLERQIWVLEKDKSISMVHSHLAVIRNGRKFWAVLYLPSPKKSAASELTLKSRNMIQCSSVIIRREIVLKLGGFDESRNLRAIEDYHLWYRLSKSHRIAFISEIHGKYRLDKAGTSANENMQNRLKAIDQALGTQSYLSQNGFATKIFAKVVNLPTATFQLVVQGTYRQRRGLSPKFR